MNRRTLGRVAVVLGLLVALNPLYLGLWFDVGHLDADPVSASAVESNENATVLAYEDFPRHTRLVVGRTIEDGEYTVLGPSNRPDEFVYPGGLDSHPGKYFVERDGDYYRLLTSGDVFSGVYLVPQITLVGLGVAVAFAGRSALRGERGPTAPALGGVVAVGLTAVGPPLGYPGFSVAGWSFAVLGVAGVVVLAAIARRAHAFLANS